MELRHAGSRATRCLNDGANSQSKQQITYTTYPNYVWITTFQKRRFVKSRRIVCSLCVNRDKRMYFVRIGRRNILWTVNCLRRHVTEWNGACDLRPARLIRVEETRQTPRQEEYLCIFGSQTLVPDYGHARNRLQCRSRKEVEVISLGIGPRMERLLALTLGYCD